MKSKDLLEGMSLIDEKYVAEADEVRLGEGRPDGSRLDGSRPRGRGYVKIAASLAACLGIAVGGIALGVHYMRQEPAIPPVTTDSGTESAGADGTDTAAPERSSDEDFVIDENGRLLAYTGTATEVYIPETVTEITANAFSQSEVADEIVKVHISSSVSQIAPTAFAPLSKVEEFTLSTSNGTFTSKNGIITDYNHIFVSPAISDGKIIYDCVWDVLNEEGYAIVVQGDLSINFDVDVLSDGSWMVYIGDMDYRGSTLRFNNSAYLHENMTFLHSDETAIVYNGQTANRLNSSEDMWVFTEAGAYTFPSADELDLTADENYNKTVLVPTGEVKDGKFGYALFPAKFAVGQDNLGDLLAYCIGTDELVREEGYMTFKNGEVVLEPEATYTVKDLFDTEAILKGVKESEDFEEFKKTYGWEDDWTVSDILEHNRQRLTPYDRENAEVVFDFETNLRFRRLSVSEAVMLMDPTVFLQEKFEEAITLESEFKWLPDLVFGEEKDPKMRIEYEDYNVEERTWGLKVSSIEAFGHSYAFEEPLCIGDCTNIKEPYNCYCNVMLTPDAFLFIHTDPATGERTALLFTESGVTDLSDETQYTYAYDNFNERITYTRTDGTESGYLTFENGEPIYNPEEPEHDSNRFKPVTVISE